MERLQIPYLSFYYRNTDSLSYLEECLAKCEYILEKPWNQSKLCQ